MEQIATQTPEKSLGASWLDTPVEEKTFADAMKEFVDRPTKALPFVGSVTEGYELYRLNSSANAMRDGTATPEQEEEVIRFLQDAARPQGAGYVFGSILSELPAFLIEVYATGGAYTAGKEGVEKLLGKAISESAEAGARRTALLTLQKVGGPVVGAGLQTGAIPTRVGVETMRQMLPEMGLTEDDAGRLDVVFGEAGPSFVEALPEGFVRTWIELVSERTGRAISQIPPIPAMKGLQAKLLEKYAGATGKSLDQAAKKLAERAGWNGVFEEWGEERVGDVLRSLIVGDPWENVIPTTDQALGELAAFAVGGSAVRAGSKLLAQKQGEEVPDGIPSPTIPSSESGASAPVSQPELAETPAQIEGAPGFAPRESLALGEESPVPTQVGEVQDTGQVEISPEGEGLVRQLAAKNKTEVRAVPAQTQAQKSDSEFAKKLGLELVLVEGAEKFPAAYAPGVVAVPAAAKSDTRRRSLLYHELVHDINEKDGHSFESLRGQIEKLDPEGLKAAGERYRVDAGLEEADAEEGVARYIEEIGGWVEGVLQNPAKLAALQKQDRSLFRRIADAVLALAKRLGIKVPASTKPKHVQAARIFKRVLETAAARKALRTVDAGFPWEVDEEQSAFSEADQREIEREAKGEGAGLLTFLRNAGGVRDNNGDLNALIGGARQGKPLVSEKGMSVDVAMREAEDAGYLPPGSAQSMSESEFVEMIRDAYNSGEDSAARFAAAPPTDSPEFKKWFGKSKVVTDDGKPLVVYHGTEDSSFTVFDVGAIGEAHGRSEGAGFYFAESSKIASGYGSRGGVLPVYLSLQNPAHYDARGLTVDRLVPLLVRAAEIEAVDLESTAEDGFLANFADTYSLGVSGAAREAAELIASDESLVDQMGGLVGAGVSPNTVNQALYETTGIDGWTADGFSNEVTKVGRIYVAFFPNQIKSATGNRGTFDPSNPDIRFAAAPNTLQDQLGFYSGVEAALEATPQKQFLPLQIRNALKKQGAKDEEIEWLGLDEWIQSKPKGEKIPKEEVFAFIKENAVVVGEKVLGIPGGPAPRAAYASRLREMSREEFAEEYALAGGAAYFGAPLDQFGRVAAEAQLVETYDPETMPRVDSAARHSTYQLPGGENYREVLLTLPAVLDPLIAFTERRNRLDAQLTEMESRGVTEGHEEWEAVNNELISTIEGEAGARDFLPSEHSFTSSHFDEPNILAHVRFNERTDAEGARVLFIEEIQSDWHQEGRKRGYKEKGEPALRKYTAEEIIVQERDVDWILSTEDGRGIPVGKGVVSTEQAAREYAVRYFNNEALAEYKRGVINRNAGVPDAPFKTSWPTLALKRMIRWGAENGFDKVAWTTGAQQVDRYQTEFRTSVSAISWEHSREAEEGHKDLDIATPQGLLELEITDRGMVRAEHAELDGKALEDVVGKEIATRILTEDSGKVEGEGLTIGGKGMVSFYDERLVATANKLGKRFGAKVGTAQLLPGKYSDERSRGQLAALTPVAREAGFRAEVRAGEGFEAPSLPITAKMRESVLNYGQARFAAAGQGEPAIDMSEEAQFERIRRYMQDALLPLRKIEDDAAKANVLLPDAERPYLVSQLRKGKTKEALVEFHTNYFKPLVDIMVKWGITLDEAGEYLEARGAPGRNETILARNDQMDVEQNPGSGVPTSVARRLQQTMETGPRGDGFLEFGVLYDSMQQEKLALMVEKETLSPDAVAEWNKQFPFYAPLMDTETEDEGVRGIGQGFDIRGPESKRAKGRGLDNRAQDILARSFAQVEMSIVRAYKNEVGEAMGKFVESHPNPAFAVIENGPFKPDPDVVLSPHVFSFKRKGEEVRIRFGKDYEHVAVALKSLEANHGQAVTRIMGSFTRTLAALSTRYNPVFPMFNAIRDVGGAAVTLSGEKGFLFAGRVMRDVPASFRALLASGPDLANPPAGKWGDYVRRYKASGAPITFLDLHGITEQLRDIDQELKRVGEGNFGKAVRAIRKAGAHIGHVNDAVENAVRLAAFVNAQEHLGMTEAQAALYAKNLTTNFERKGEIGAILNAWYMFSNAGIQGTQRVLSAMKHPGTRRIVFSAVAGAALLDTLNRVIGGDDEDGIPFYDKIKPHVKRTHFILMYPDGSGKHVTIPLPFVYNFFHALGTNMGALFGGAQSVEEVAGDLTIAAMDSFNPLGGASHPLEVLSPTAVDPFLQHGMNQDWAGRAIMPTRLPWGIQKPDSEMYWPTVNPTLKSVTANLNRLSGGDEFEAGYFDVSPETIEHFWSFLVGGLGTTLGRTWDLGDKFLRDEEIERRDIPLVRRLSRTQNPWQHASLFRENAAKVETAQKRLSQAQALRDSKRIAEVREEQRELLGLYPLLRSSKKRLTKLYARRERLEGDPLERVEEQIRSIHVAFNTKANQL